MNNNIASNIDEIDNNNININKNNDIEYIRHLYDGLGYFDIYGGSVLLFILLTIFVFLFYTFCKVMQYRQEIADDWANQRCNPKYIPFAGYINKPDDAGVMEYTNENFQYCVQNTTTNTTGVMVEPINALMSGITDTFDKLNNAAQNMREILNKLRERIRKIAEEIFGRILNVMVPIQQLFIYAKDIFAKTEGVLTASLYTMFGSYYTLQSLMGAILELIIKMLVALVIIIVGLWLSPFTMPIAGAMTSVFMAISIPMAIIIVFMTEVLHIKTSGLPKLRCFDENVLVTLNDGTKKKIKDINSGDYLENNVRVTSTMCVTSEDLKMFDLHGVIVSESHIVQYYHIWIPVMDHPHAKQINNYNKPYLYCLNTSSKEIVINNCIFTDWDEIYGSNLDKIIQHIPQNKDAKTDTEKRANIHKYLEKGYNGQERIRMIDNTTKLLKDLCIDDYLSTGGQVYGIVKILNNQNQNNMEMDKNDLGIIYNILSTSGDFEMNNQIYKDYNFAIDFIITNNKNII